MLDFTKKDMLEIEAKVSSKKTVFLGFEKSLRFLAEMTQAQKELELYMFNALKDNKNLSKLASINTDNFGEALDTLEKSDLDITKIQEMSASLENKQREIIRSHYTFKQAQEQFEAIEKEQYERVIEELFNVFNEKKK